jgi:hypothetical protein
LTATQEVLASLSTCYPGASIEIVVISPDQALAWLETANTMNRPVMSGRVAMYANDMKAGRWVFNAQAICFDANGNLIDGQHRLWACVESSIPLIAVVARGLPKIAQNTIDIGARRTAGQAAHLSGITNGNALAAIARLILTYDRYDKQFGKTGRAPTQTEVSTYTIENWREMDAALRISMKCGKPLHVATIAGFCYFVFSRIDQKAADAFFDKLIKGGCPNTDPLFHLRERLLQHTNARYTVRREDVIALFFKCWNYHRQGRPMRHLANKANEALPEIV